MTNHFCAFLAATLLCCTFCCSGNVVNIKSGKELKDHFNSSSISPNDVIELENDISLDLEHPLGIQEGHGCKAFEGIFKGNNHSIKDISMNTQSSSLFQSAGLFCEIRDATIRDLIIDKSCSFKGSWSGALSCRVSGSLTLINVQNYGSVIGKEITGGFIGCGENIQGATLSFVNCINNATVEKTESQQYGCGGFIGSIANSQIEVSFRNCINNGTIQGTHILGGFIGMMENNNHLKVFFESTTNQGTINKGMGIGGFVGASQNNTESSISFLSCKNSGTVSGENDVGGFVGSFASNSNMIVLVNKSQNSGYINGSTFEGGFIGNIHSSKEHSISISITNSINSGEIEGIACGFFCVYYPEDHQIDSFVSNCVNNGTMKGNYTLGFHLKSHQFITLLTWLK